MIKFKPSEWIGLKDLGTEEFERLKPTAEKAVFRALLHFEGAVKRTLQGKRSGRIYKVSKTGKLHQASAPGEPPAVLFGKLRQSITHVGPTWNGDNVSGEVGTNVEYSAILEFGGVTSKGVRILPRPYMLITFLLEQDTLEKILEGGASTK